MTTPIDDAAGLLPFDEPPRRLFSAYPTRLTTWHDCPRRYRFQYLDPRPKAGPWAHYSVGSSAHAALHRWYDLEPVERTPAAAAGLVDRHWVDQGFRDEAQSQRMRAVVKGWVEQYCEGVDAAVDPVGVERTVATTTSVLSVRGRVDRIDARKDDDGNDELVVVDYKTSRRPPVDDDARASLQLALYAAASARTLRRPCTKVELHHLPTGTVAAWRHRPDTLERHLRRADEIGLEAAAAEQGWKDAGGAVAAEKGDPRIDEAFPAVASSRCGWCDYVGSCREGSAVSTAHRSWDALPIEATDPTDAVAADPVE